MGNSGYIGGLERNWATTEFSCVVCGEGVLYAEESHVVTIVTIQMTERGTIYSPLIFDDGDFLWEPQFICSDCWDQCQEELTEHVRDVPLIEDDYAITDCRSCRSGIRAGEVVGMITAGEVRQTHRYPNGEHGGTTFECSNPDPCILCISCINRLNSDVVDELWSEPIKQYQECEEGTQIRCWRNGCPAEEDNDCANCHKQTG